ncbi:MAG: zinc ribbon domain-containing protein [Dehalococcoidia bacterium]
MRGPEVASPNVPLFSERLTELLNAMFKGEAPNAGRFCGHCYTPLGPERERCPHCDRSVSEQPPVDQVPKPVLAMFRQLRRRESLVVNGFAYLGLLLGVLTFIGVFYVLFSSGADVWWYVFDIVLLFVLARGLAGLLGGILGDELGYRYARRKLAEDWAAYERGEGAYSTAD